MALVKTYITIPRKYIRKKVVEKALQSFGKWENRDKDSTDIVNELRTDRNYVRHNS